MSGMRSMPLRLHPSSFKRNPHQILTTFPINPTIQSIWWDWKPSRTFVSLSIAHCLSWQPQKTTLSSLPCKSSRPYPHLVPPDTTTFDAWNCSTLWVVLNIILRLQPSEKIYPMETLYSGQLQKVTLVVWKMWVFS